MEQPEDAARNTEIIRKTDPGWNESTEDKAELAGVSNQRSPDKAPSSNRAQCLLQTWSRAVGGREAAGPSES